MATPKILNESLGHWAGTSELHLSWLPQGENILKSATALTITSDRHNTFATLRYTWTHEEEEQDGMLLISADGMGGCTAGWSDSWHQSRTVMPLSGEAKAKINLKGFYKVEGHPDWSWRIQILLNGSALILEMFNVSPEGEEEWAVRGTYQRA